MTWFYWNRNTLAMPTWSRSASQAAMMGWQSFNSDLSNQTTASSASLEMLLNDRQADPEMMLLSLGFGGQTQQYVPSVARVPSRFLRQPSKAQGVATPWLHHHESEDMESCREGDEDGTRSPAAAASHSRRKPGGLLLDGLYFRSYYGYVDLLNLYLSGNIPTYFFNTIGSKCYEVVTQAEYQEELSNESDDNGAEGDSSALSSSMEAELSDLERSEECMIAEGEEECSALSSSIEMESGMSNLDRSEDCTIPEIDSYDMSASMESASSDLDRSEECIAQEVDSYLMSSSVEAGLSDVEESEEYMIPEENDVSIEKEDTSLTDDIGPSTPLNVTRDVKESPDNDTDTISVKMSSPPPSKIPCAQADGQTGLKGQSKLKNISGDQSKTYLKPVGTKSSPDKPKVQSSLKKITTSHKSCQHTPPSIKLKPNAQTKENSETTSSSTSKHKTESRLKEPQKSGRNIPKPPTRKTQASSSHPSTSTPSTSTKLSVPAASLTPHASRVKTGGKSSKIPNSSALQVGPTKKKTVPKTKNLNYTQGDTLKPSSSFKGPPVTKKDNSKRQLDKGKSMKQLCPDVALNKAVYSNGSKLDPKPLPQDETIVKSVSTNLGASKHGEGVFGRRQSDPNDIQIGYSVLSSSSLLYNEGQQKAVASSDTAFSSSPHRMALMQAFSLPLLTLNGDRLDDVIPQVYKSLQRPSANGHVLDQSQIGKADGDEDDNDDDDDRDDWSADDIEDDEDDSDNETIRDLRSLNEMLYSPSFLAALPLTNAFNQNGTTETDSCSLSNVLQSLSSPIDANTCPFPNTACSEKNLEHNMDTDGQTILSCDVTYPCSVPYTYTLCDISCSSSSSPISPPSTTYSNPSRSSISQALGETIPLVLSIPQTKTYSDGVPPAIVYPCMTTIPSLTSYQPTMSCSSNSNDAASVETSPTSAIICSSTPHSSFHSPDCPGATGDNKSKNSQVCGDQEGRPTHTGITPVLNLPTASASSTAGVPVTAHREISTLVIPPLKSPKTPKSTRGTQSDSHPVQSVTKQIALFSTKVGLPSSSSSLPLSSESSSLSKTPGPVAKVVYSVLHIVPSRPASPASSAEKRSSCLSMPEAGRSTEIGCRNHGDLMTSDVFVDPDLSMISSSSSCSDGEEDII